MNHPLEKFLVAPLILLLPIKQAMYTYHVSTYVVIAITKWRVMLPLYIGCRQVRTEAFARSSYNNIRSL